MTNNLQYLGIEPALVQTDRAEGTGRKLSRSHELQVRNDGGRGRGRTNNRKTHQSIRHSASKWRTEGRKVGKRREQEEEHLCSAKEAQPDNAYREQFGTTARAGIATRPSASLLGRKEGRAQQCVLSPSRATACLEPYLLYSGIGIERAAECCK